MTGPQVPPADERSWSLHEWVGPRPVCVFCGRPASFLKETSDLGDWSRQYLCTTCWVAALAPEAVE